MKRTALTDGSGRWFDTEKAEAYEEKSWHNGNNWISKATGDQFVHETIYHTKGGVFILNHRSQWQGSIDTYKEITREEAAEWFAKQEFTDDELPKVLRSDVYGLEIE